MISLIRQRKLLMALAALLCWLAASFTWTWYFSAAPVNVPVTSGNTFDADVRIRLRESYRLDLMLLAGKLDAPEFSARTAAWKNNSGVDPLDVHWTFTDTAGRIVATGTTRTRDADWWSSSSLGRGIAAPGLAPGRYRLAGQLGLVSPSMQGMDIRLVMNPANSTAWTSWQLTVAWLATAISYLLVVPATVLLLLVGIWRAARFRAWV